MQGKRVLVRETLLQDEAARIVGILPDITTWTSWMKSTTHIISSTQNTLVQGDEFELQRIVKGALVQENGLSKAQGVQIQSHYFTNWKSRWMGKPDLVKMSEAQLSRCR